VLSIASRCLSFLPRSSNACCSYFYITTHHSTGCFRGRARDSGEYHHEASLSVQVPLLIPYINHPFWCPKQVIARFNSEFLRTETSLTPHLPLLPMSLFSCSLPPMYVFGRVPFVSINYSSRAPFRDARVLVQVQFHFPPSTTHSKVNKGRRAFLKPGIMSAARFVRVSLSFPFPPRVYHSAPFPR